jgi:hypothetical protein
MKLTRILANYTGGLNFIDTTQIWVGKNGSDSSGDGTVTAPYLTITQALASVTSGRKTIIVMPGAYVEAAALVWPAISGVVLFGMGLVTLSAAGTTKVLGIAPGALTDTFDVRIENVDFYHNGTSQDGILIDNTGCGKKIVLTLCNVSGDPGDGGGDMIATVHADAANAIRIYWNGDHGEGIDSRINFTVANNGDRLYITNCDLAGGVNTSATDIAADLRLVRCTVKHEGITGGHATQTLDLVDCYSQTGGTFAAADGSDVAGDMTETIV